MILFFNHLEAPYACVFDIEHDQGRLIQFAGLIFKRVGEGLYQVCRNLNVYVKQDITPFFKQFSKITQDFLNQYGVSLEEATALFEQFIQGIEKNEMVFCSHGVFQDSLILERNGIMIKDYPSICTYELAKKVLQRNNHVTVHDLCSESGCVGMAEHNAYSDAFMAACILSFLLKQGDENYEDVES